MVYVTWLDENENENDEEPNIAQFENFDSAVAFCEVEGLDPKESIAVMCW